MRSARRAKAWLMVLIRFRISRASGLENPPHMLGPSTVRANHSRMVAKHSAGVRGGVDTRIC
jgi:hypothetical protein